jgi:hypothetical protein
MRLMLLSALKTSLSLSRHKSQLLIRKQLPERGAFHTQFEENYTDIDARW